MQRFFSLMAVCLLLIGTGCSRARTGQPKLIDQYNLENPVVKLGVEVLFERDEYLNHLRGKRVGLITNQTGVDSKLRSTIDLINDHPEIELVRLFGPEHGVRGAAYAGDKVEDAVDARTGVPEKSLYGETRRPPQETLADLDVLIYDIQDVGSRSYTNIYTMAYAMEEAAKAGIPFMVLDRPNPCGPVTSGNILDQSEFSTFVGLYAIPYQYSMTPGEIAQIFNDRFNAEKVELIVVPMEGYTRDMLYWDSGLPFVPTSPHIPSSKISVYYNLTGIIGELDKINIGVGYTMPFEMIAAPYINADEFADEMRKKNLPGLLFRPVTYKPFYSRFKGEIVQGVHIIISDYRAVQPVEAQLHMMEVLQRLYPESNLFVPEEDRKVDRTRMFDQVMGTSSIRKRILAGDSADAIISDYQDDVAEFMEMRKPYLIYR